MSLNIFYFIQYNSQFCGHKFCGKHCNGRRSNPENPQEVAQSCVFCTEEYLRKTVDDDWDLKINGKEEVLRSIEKTLNLLNE